MGRLNRIKFFTYKCTAIVGALAMAGAMPGCLSVLWYTLRRLPEAKHTIGVQAADFSEATESAMRRLNEEAGCKFLVPGENVKVSSSDGSPCGRLWDEENLEATGHSAGAYQCSPGQWEILVSYPGDLHTQLCIVAHELGHVAGMGDGGRGIMNQHECPEHLLASDAERAYLSAKFCH